MSWTVTLYFDNMIDETHYFENRQDALRKLEQLKSANRGRKYRVDIEEVTDGKAD